MAEPQESEGSSTVTVRMDKELVRLARIVCAVRSKKLVEYLDALVRAAIIADHAAAMSGRGTTATPTRPPRKKRAKSDPEGR